jgi:hypothetical protein
VSGSSEGSEGTENVDVDLAGVSLSSDGVGVLESGEFGDELIKFLDLNREIVSFSRAPV